MNPEQLIAEIKALIENQNNKNFGKELLLIFFTSTLGFVVAFCIQAYALSSTHEDKLDSMYRSELLKEFKNASKVFNKISSVYLYQNEVLVKERKDLNEFKQEISESLSNLQSLLSNQNHFEQVSKLKRQSQSLIDDIYNTKLAVQLCDSNNPVAKDVCESTLNLRNLRLVVAQCHFCKTHKDSV